MTELFVVFCVGFVTGAGSYCLMTIGLKDM